MATKPSNSDGFANPLYDKLLVLVHETSEDLIDKWWGGDWTSDEVNRISESLQDEIPDRPMPKLISREWQKTLQKAQPVRSAYDEYELVDAGTVDLSLRIAVPKLKQSFDRSMIEPYQRTRDVQAVWSTIDLHFICRPILKSIAATLKTLNEFRDRKREDSSESTEIFGVLTSVPDHRDVFVDQGYRYLYFEPSLLD